MTPKEIGEQLVAVHAALVEKLEAQPFIDPSLKIDQAGKCAISLYTAFVGGDYKVFARISEDNIEAAFKSAFKAIAALPDPETAATRKFHKNLANVIDEGNSLNMPTEVMAPLSEGMTALSENLLTHQPEVNQ